MHAADLGIAEAYLRRLGIRVATSWTEDRPSAWLRITVGIGQVGNAECFMALKGFIYGILTAGGRVELCGIPKGYEGSFPDEPGFRVVRT